MARLDYKNGLWLYTGSPAERWPAKNAGFRWDPVAKRWQTPDAAKALAVVGADSVTIDAETRELLTGVREAKVEALAASRANDADIDVPAPAGLDYLPYQRAGIAYALGRDGVLIGDEMGLGKTIQALGVLNADESIRRTLVVCPASVRLNWAREARKWLLRETKISIVTGGKLTDVRVEYDPMLPTGELVIINYDLLAKHRGLREAHWDLLVVDEAHYIKSPTAKRTQMILGKFNKDPAKRIHPIGADRKLFLTGTPIPNRPVELYPLLSSLDPRRFGNWRRFVERYCAGVQRWQRIRGGRSKLVWDVTGASHLDELQERMRESVLVRRVKEDVLTELPSKRRQVIALAPNGADRVLSKERELLAGLLGSANSPEEYAAALAQLTKSRTEKFEEISRIRHEIALEKARTVAQHVIDAVESGSPVVLFGHHKDALDIICEALTKAEVAWVRVDGDTSMQDRQAAVDAFQRPDGPPVIVGTIGAMGVGLTLTRSSHVVFGELSWVPGEVQQAEDRCHRIGQRESVLVQHLVYAGSLEQHMAEYMVAKAKVQDAALDNEIVVPELPAATEPAPEVEPSAPREVDPDEEAAVLACLRALAARCDGAATDDGKGYNGTDSSFGKSLAGRSRLTPRQIAAAKRMLRKYRGQLTAYGLGGAYELLYKTAVSA